MGASKSDSAAEGSLLDRFGAAIRRWTPWPDIVVFGGGGSLVIIENLTWGRPDDTVRLWFGVAFGVAAIVVGFLHLWIYSSPAE